jgi:hypothetical protein
MAEFKKTIRKKYIYIYTCTFVYLSVSLSFSDMFMNHFNYTSILDFIRLLYNACFLRVFLNTQIDYTEVKHTAQK